MMRLNKIDDCWRLERFIKSACRWQVIAEETSPQRIQLVLSCVAEALEYSQCRWSFN